MMKLMKNPSEAMTIQGEIAALKLNSEENKEMKARMQKQATQMISQGKQQAMNMGGITQQQIDKQKENQERIVPLKDEARINAVLKRPLAENELKKFCKAVHEAVKKQMNPKAIVQAEEFYKKIKAESNSPVSLGNGAISCYLSNLTHQSIYILGRVCSEENFDANNINNYAALLTNHGVETGAIPLLNFLHKKYGQDPVIYSNLAMAWLGLGDLKTAEKFADSCVRYFPDRSHQAHYVKCIVEEGNGNHQAAVEQLTKSTGQVYSAEKEQQLRKWGGKLKAANQKKHLPADALGLSKFVFPELPLTYEAHFDKKGEWAMYYYALEPEIKKLEQKEPQLNAAVNKESKDMAAAMINNAGAKAGYAYAANNSINMSWWYYFNDIELEYAFKEDKLRNELAELLLMADTLQKEMVKDILESVNSACGDDDAKCPAKVICDIHLSAYNRYMETVNSKLAAFYEIYMKFKRTSINERVYAAKYCLPDAAYERYKNERKLEFLKAMKIIRYQNPAFGNTGPSCVIIKTNPLTKKELHRFEDIHCPPDWKLEIPGGSGVSTHCTKITLTLAFGIGEATYTEDLLTDKWTNMTLELGREIGSKNIKGIEVSAGATAFIEIDRQGITDWGVKGKVGADAIGIVKDGTIGEGGGGVLQAGGEVKISMMSGKPSFDTKAGFNSTATEIAKAFK
jgi:hypothetical protein